MTAGSPPTRRRGGHSAHRWQLGVRASSPVGPASPYYQHPVRGGDAAPLPWSSAFRRLRNAVHGQWSAVNGAWVPLRVLLLAAEGIRARVLGRGFCNWMSASEHDASSPE